MKDLQIRDQSDVTLFSQKTFDNDKNNWGHHLLLAIAGGTAISGFVMDMNRTHMFNPRWTPHSKFHDAITIMNGTFLGSAALYFLLSKKQRNKSGLGMGAFLPGIFWGSLLSAFAFPGAKGIESEFPEKVPKIGNVAINESAAASLTLLLLVVGYIKARKKNL